MGASRFVGRVGGLAVALGVGAAAFSGAGTAWADTSDPGSDSSGSTRAASANDAAAPARGRKAAAPAPAAASTESRTRQQRTARPDPDSIPAASSARSVPVLSDAAATTAKVVSELAASAAAEDIDATVAVDIDPSPVELVPDAPPVPRIIVDPVIDPVTYPDIDPVVDQKSEPAPAPADEVSAFLSEADNGLADGAGTDPILPADSPLEWALLAFARRQPLSVVATANQVASVTSSQTVSSGGLVVDPSVEFVDGVFQGTLNATSSRGATLTYTFLDSSNGGKLDLDTVPIPGGTDPQSYTILPYATWLNPGGVKGTEEFQVRVSEVTDFDKFLINIPLIGLVAAPVIDLLQRLPLISDLLAPIIGSSVVATVSVDVATLAPGATPLAFTYDVISFDGTPISTNFFPASGIADGEQAPTVLNGPGLGSPGETDPYNEVGTFGSVPGVGLMRDEGYNVITWDPRGEFASGGVLQLDNPFFEGRDVSAIVSWAADNPLVELENPDDPAVGMVGGSYGGGIQMVTASTDPRIDAIVPNGNWYSLNDALYPAEEFKTAWALDLLLALVESGARINNQIYAGVLTGSLFGFLTETAQAVLASSGPTSLLNQLQIPTLLFQGTVDALFPLDQSVLNAETIVANPWDTLVKLAWFCGGHGACLTGTPPAQQDLLFAQTFAWLDQYVAGDGSAAEQIPVFQWWDQDGLYHSSDLLPFEPGFLRPLPYSTTGDGGVLGIVPILGGSGPSSPPGVSFPVNLIFPTEAANAINVALTPTVGDQIVGAPQVSFTYRGLGTGGAVYAQIVDNATGLVVGNNVTAIPVTLDGRERTVSMSLNDIAYTVGAGDSLTLQITSWSSIFANAAIGLVDISDIEVDLPVRAPLTVV
jgi:ABC-2 type transport system ATP-binding protein